MFLGLRSISTSRLLAACVTLAFAVSLPIALPRPAEGKPVDATQAMKDKWQADYRRLLQDADRLRRNARNARENYVHAQRRNYPRGGARQQMLIEAEEAERGLVEVEARIEQLRLDARRAGALPGWFYEVDDEPRGMAQPASPAETTGPSPDDRAGRNPLYLDRE
ncbi:MAG: hypothetical protein V3T64_00150 [Myxococcota bacterium]